MKLLLPTDSNADPSLQELQRRLKKSRLQDSLRGRIANRPGPLELVEGNILQTDPDLKDAIIGRPTFLLNVGWGMVLQCPQLCHV